MNTCAISCHSVVPQWKLASARPVAEDPEAPHADLVQARQHLARHVACGDGLLEGVAVDQHRRLQRLDITAVEADVLQPLPVDGTFDSAALHGVIHCLPGPLSRKAAAVANVAAALAPTGVLFGASILGPSGPHTWLSRMILNTNNRRCIFDNLDDTLDGLGEMLGASFEQVELETIGSMAVFAATNPRTQPPIQ